MQHKRPTSVIGRATNGACQALFVPRVAGAIQEAFLLSAPFLQRLE